MEYSILDLPYDIKTVLLSTYEYYGDDELTVRALSKVNHDWRKACCEYFEICPKPVHNMLTSLFLNQEYSAKWDIPELKTSVRVNAFTYKEGEFPSGPWLGNLELGQGSSAFYHPDVGNIAVVYEIKHSYYSVSVLGYDPTNLNYVTWYTNKIIASGDFERLEH